MVAFVSLGAGAEITPDELIECARDRIGGYKYPREVHVLDAIPLTAVGKIHRKALRRRVAEPAGRRSAVNVQVMRRRDSPARGIVPSLPRAPAVVHSTLPSGLDRIGSGAAETLGAVGTTRLESFSDGVIAVAITLLVLGIGIPSPGRGGSSLAYQLGHQWPQYAAYVVSFVTIGIIWINHHAMISRLKRADHSILILNLLLLMTIGILPFATGVMAAYLRAPDGQSLAAAVYSGSFLLMSVAFAALNRHILLGRAHMLSEEVALQERRRILARSVTGLVPYLVATILALVSAYATLTICASLAIFYALPIASGSDRQR